MGAVAPKGSRRRTCLGSAAGGFLMHSTADAVRCLATSMLLAYHKP
jgi:hypothetical protein